MFSRKNLFAGLGVLLILLYAGSSYASGSYLISLELKTSEDFQQAADLGLKQ